LAALDAKADVAQRPEIRVSCTTKGKKLAQPVRRTAVERKHFRDVLDKNHSGKSTIAWTGAEAQQLRGLRAVRLQRRPGARIERKLECARILLFRMGRLF